MPDYTTSGLIEQTKGRISMPTSQSLITTDRFISILNDEINDKMNLLSQSEKDSLVKLRQVLNVYTITKTKNGIYYGLWGFLDVRLGITYWTKSELPNENYSHLKGKWYH